MSRGLGDVYKRQCIDSAIDFVADLYDLSIDEVKRAMDGEEYWCI